MTPINDDREVTITLTLREWQSVFGALGDTPKEQRDRRQALWPGAIDCTHAAMVARRKVREQMKEGGSI